MKIVINGDVNNTLSALQYAELIMPEIGIIKLSAILLQLIGEGVSDYKINGKMEEVRLIKDND